MEQTIQTWALFETTILFFTSHNTWILTQLNQTSGTQHEWMEFRLRDSKEYKVVGCRFYPGISICRPGLEIAIREDTKASEMRD